MSAMKYNEIPAVITVEELAETLRIGRNSAYKLVKSGEIDIIRIGRTIRIPRKALLDYLSGER